MKRFFEVISGPDGCPRRASRAAFELPGRERVRCPDCLEKEMSVSEAEVRLDVDGALLMTYRASCSSCGFSVLRDESYQVPLMAALDALVMLDLRLTA
jgi:hypothetical protein